MNYKALLEKAYTEQDAARQIGSIEVVAYEETAQYILVSLETR